MKRIPVYLWAGTASLLGLIFVPLALISGGTIQIVDGVLEISGGLVARFLKSGVFMLGGAGAMTLGHVVLGQDESWLARSRQHERVHVKQYERWGILMIPLYLWSSCAARLRGGHLYWDNRFEREAYAEAGETAAEALRFIAITTGERTRGQGRSPKAKKSLMPGQSHRLTSDGEADSK